jgi:peptide/nickel transport system substrate-binding protein
VDAQNHPRRAIRGHRITDQDGANKMWAEIDKQVTDKSAAAALFTPKHLDFVSKRLGNFQFNSQYYWMVTQSWVK